MKNVNLKLVKMEDIKFNDNLFIPMKTKTIVDSILSTEGGIYPGTNTVVKKNNQTTTTVIIIILLEKKKSEMMCKE